MRTIARIQAATTRHAATTLISVVFAALLCVDLAARSLAA
jgi:hypothetical protein